MDTDLLKLSEIDTNVLNLSLLNLAEDIKDFYQFTWKAVKYADN